MKFNEKLVKLRKENLLSQEELAEKLGVTRQTISKWELEQTTPDMDKLSQMAKLFNVSVDELLNEADEPTKTNKASDKNNNKKNTAIVIILIIVLIVVLGGVGISIFNKPANSVENGKENVGIIGVFGGHYLPRMFPAAYVDGPCSGSFIQGHLNNGQYYTELVNYRNYIKNNISDCVLVDGMWFCGTKDLFSHIQFDEVTFQGFHCYDMDICMQALALYKKVEVVYDIKLEHKSVGVIDERYYEQLRLWYIKWQNYLPIKRGIEESDIPAYLHGLEEFGTKKSLEKEYWKRLYEDIAYSKRYRMISKFFHIMSLFNR